jgi:hypothetical protein
MVADIYHSQSLPFTLMMTNLSFHPSLFHVYPSKQGVSSFHFVGNTGNYLLFTKTGRPVMEKRYLRMNRG